MNIKKFLPMTETTYYIMLSLLEPLHGYGIMQQVKQYSKNTVDIAPGTLYGALENLKKQKLIGLLTQPENERRKVYQLTELGCEVLHLEFERMQALVKMSEPLLKRSK